MSRPSDTYQADVRVADDLRDRVARIAVPCVCARGREVADSLGKAELAREEAKHAPRKPKGWVRA